VVREVWRRNYKTWKLGKSIPGKVQRGWIRVSSVGVGQRGVTPDPIDGGIFITGAKGLSEERRIGTA